MYIFYFSLIICSLNFIEIFYQFIYTVGIRVSGSVSMLVDDLNLMKMM